MRMDLVYVTKELSRVLAEPTKIANELVDRATEYTIKPKRLTYGSGYDPWIYIDVRILRLVYSDPKLYTYSSRTNQLCL
jgi:hypothetical protein